MPRWRWEGRSAKTTDSVTDTHASGERSIAIGEHSFVGAAFTGDNARAIQLPVEAFRPIAQVQAPPGIDNVPARSAHFVGRERELARLDSALSGAGPVVLAVHGLGGIGKTTLVAEWAARGGRAPVRWVTADTSAGVERGLAEFAGALQPALAQVLTVEQLAERTLQWLATHSGWLLVLDNVNNPADIADVLARAHGGGRIVITSRLGTGWQSVGAAIVRVDVLESSDSEALLTGLVTADGPRSLDGVVELCAVLGHLPLAVEQAGAYLAQNPFITPRGYLDLLSQYPGDMYRQTGEAADPDRTIARIWRVTLDRIITDHPLAADVLRILAWYAPDTIPVTLLEGLADPPALHSALGALVAYNMITPNPERGTLAIHRLVQAVARTPDLDDGERMPAVIEHAHARAAVMLRKALPDWGDPATWPTWRLLLPHVDVLLARSGDDTVVTAEILSRAGKFLEGQGGHDRAIAYAHRAFAARARILGNDHPDTLGSRHDLASAYGSAGETTEAISRYERNLADRERVLGTDHPDTLTSQNNLAEAYSKAGRIAEAIPLLERTLTDREQILSSDHPDTLASRNNLASVYGSAGRTLEAIPVLERTVTDIERVLGPGHPSALTSRNNLAGAYESAGRFTEAIDLLERNLADRARILGSDHPDTLTARNNLASAYRRTGRNTEAIALLERNLADTARILGPDHTTSLTSRNNLASLYGAAGRVIEAIPLYERNLADRERILGPDHPDTLTSRNNLADAYSRAGRSTEAIALHERNLADRERILGDDHPHTLSSLNNLASAYSKAGRATDAIPLYDRTIADSERILGPDHPDTLTCRNNLASAYHKTGRTAEAIVLHERNLTDRTRILGTDHPDTVSSRNAIDRLRSQRSPD
ncbi:tetratricopeptide repeat protein [Nocardia goodfellowii]|uniref:Tetratricopeptide (TPR) repeat protein n=1 Tax=Nocardia goodfellowii TaxID=882446 RepID=A0ABS4QFN2_9NOCA|nr:tetratricopeptide repeat protein [Nocardia goodfellowii]MBP2190480.1 tetratricopeptide (TPR) repeat protein [Nocardia goodfellowii]